MLLSSEAPDADPVVSGVVVALERFGDHNMAHIKGASGLTWVARTDADELVKIGHNVTLTCDQQRIMLFAPGPRGRNIRAVGD
jgi:hypothetical protein